MSVVVGSVVTPESAEKCCAEPRPCPAHPPVLNSHHVTHRPSVSLFRLQHLNLTATVVIALVCVSRPGPSPSHLAINPSTLFPCTSVVYLPWTLISTDLLDPVPSSPSPFISCPRHTLFSWSYHPLFDCHVHPPQTPYTQRAPT